VENEGEWRRMAEGGGEWRFGLIFDYNYNAAGRGEGSAEEEGRGEDRQLHPQNCQEKGQGAGFDEYSAGLDSLPARLQTHLPRGRLLEEGYPGNRGASGLLQAPQRLSGRFLRETETSPAPSQPPSNRHPHSERPPHRGEHPQHRRPRGGEPRAEPALAKHKGAQQLAEGHRDQGLHLRTALEVQRGLREEGRERLLSPQGGLQNGAVQKKHPARFSTTGSRSKASRAKEP